MFAQRVLQVVRELRVPVRNVRLLLLLECSDDVTQGRERLVNRLRLFETLPSGLRTVNALRSSQVDHPQPALADKWSILSLVRGYIRGADLQGDHAVAPRRVLVHARKRSRPVPAKVIIFNAKVLVFDTQFLVFEVQNPSFLLTRDQPPTT